MSDLYYVVDVRQTWSWRPFVSLWGADNKGYHYSMATGYAGAYTASELVPGYHYEHVYGSVRTLERYPVPVDVCISLGVEPPRDGPHRIELPGLVIHNTADIRARLRRARLVIGDPTAFDRAKAEAQP
jgi:hypothetical protein